MYNSTIITIGDELTSGYRLDTNSQWLSSELSKIGIKTLFLISIGDDKKIIINSLIEESKKNIDYIFVTGGIGPTDDDKTFDAIREFLKAKEYLDEEYLSNLKIRFNSKKREGSALLEKQSRKIQDVAYFSNPVGTALPFSFSKNQTTFFVLPGVPLELKKICQENIFPLISKRESGFNEVILNIVGLSENSLHEKIADILKRYSKEMRFSFLPNLNRITLRLTVPLESAADMKEVKKIIIEKIGKYYLGEGEIELEEVVLKLLISKKLTLSIAESCTGGAISQLITNFPGSSEVFKGSIIAYSNQVKRENLNISNTLLEKYGAVSAEIAEKMCKNIAEKMNTDIAISVTGISGPDGGTQLKPVGLVYISVKYLNNISTKKFNFPGNRGMHRLLASSASLNILRLMLINKWDFNDKKSN